MEEEKEEGEEDDDEEEEEEMKEEQSISGSESSRVRERHYEVRTVGFPKSDRWVPKVPAQGDGGWRKWRLAGRAQGNSGGEWLVVVLVSHCCGNSGYVFIVNMFMSCFR